MIRAKTYPTIEGFKKYWWSKPLPYLYIILFCSLAVVQAIEFIAAAFLFLISEGGFTDVIITFLFLVLSVLLIIYNCRMPHRLFKNSQKLCSDVVETITFGDNSFVAENVGSKISERVENFYNTVTSAKNSDGWFIIVCERYRFYAFTESQITDGTADDLRNLLKSKLGKKFK